MVKVTRIIYITLLTMLLSITSAYAQHSLTVIWEAPAQWVDKEANVTALETKLKSLLPATEYAIQSISDSRARVSAYRDNHSLTAKSAVEAPPRLSSDAVFSLAAGNDYVMVLHMDAVITDYFATFGDLPRVVDYYVFDIADMKIFNVKTRKLLYKKQFMSKANNSGVNAFFAIKDIDRISQQRKDEIFQTSLDKWLENFTFDASHIHRLEQ